MALVAVLSVMLVVAPASPGPSHGRPPMAERLIAEATGAVGGCTSNSTALTASMSPANATGEAPLTVQWNLTRPAGSVGPYSWTLQSPAGGAGAAGTNDLNLSFRFTSPGSYGVTIDLEDNRTPCQEYTGTFAVDVLSSGGHGSLRITPHAVNGTAPYAAQFTANVTGITNYSVRWIAEAYPWSGSGSTFRAIFLENGTPVVEADLLDARGNIINTSAVVANITGASVFSATATPDQGPAPLNVSFAAHLRTTAYTPGQPVVEWHLYDSPNRYGMTVNYTFSVPPPWGGGTITINVDLYNASGQLWAETWLLVTVEPGSPGQDGIPYPLATVDPGFTYGVAPFAESIRVTGYGGATPYSLQMCLVGASGSNGSSSCWANVTDWNGSTLTFNRTWTSPGTYTFWADMTDAHGHLAGTQLAYAVVNNTTALQLTAATTGQSGSAAYTVGFSAHISGGTAPYAVLWSFGDGQRAVGGIGSTVEHTYVGAGQYRANVTVTDESGSTVTAQFAISVAAPTPELTSPDGSGPPSGSGTSPGGPPEIGGVAYGMTAGVIALSALVAVLLVHRGWRKEGELLLAVQRPGGASRSPDRRRPPVERK